jgi:hypothetical protein
MIAATDEAVRPGALRRSMRVVGVLLLALSAITRASECNSCSRSRERASRSSASASASRRSSGGVPAAPLTAYRMPPFPLMHIAGVIVLLIVVCIGWQDPMSAARVCSSPSPSCRPRLVIISWRSAAARNGTQANPAIERRPSRDIGKSNRLTGARPLKQQSGAAENGYAVRLIRTSLRVSEWG